VFLSLLNGRDDTKDIKAGEKIDGIGGYCVRGVLETHADLVKNNNVP
jgi:predicted homoserine dehydrogenase-like protein